MERTFVFIGIQLSVFLLAMLFPGSSHAGFLIAEPQGDRGQTIICTSVVKASLDPTQTITANNPIDRLTLVPTICSGGGMSQSVKIGGIQQLIQAGWIITQASHQVTALTLSTGQTPVEILVSGVFVLEGLSLKGVAR